MTRYQRRPPSTLPCIGLGCAFLSRSRSAQRLSILSSIRASSASAGSEFIPARWSCRISLRCRETWPRIRSISTLTDSSRMTFSLGQRLLDLPADGRGRAAFPFEKPQPVPKPDDFPFPCGVHGSLRIGRHTRTNHEYGKPLSLVVSLPDIPNPVMNGGELPGLSHRHLGPHRPPPGNPHRRLEKSPRTDRGWLLGCEDLLSRRPGIRGGPRRPVPDLIARRRPPYP